MLSLWLVSLLLCSGSVAANSAPVQSFEPPRTLSSSAKVSLVTVMPGDQAWNLFGHGALRIVDPVYRLDLTFNYGMFTFDDGFIARFVYGELDYRLEAGTFNGLLAGARFEERTVIEQSLDLDGKQRQALYEALMINAQPENRTYRYDFLFDNCSTRLVNVLRDTLGPGLVLPRGPDAELSFRELLATHLGPHPWFALGIDTALGSEVDQRATFEEGWFLPALFLEAMDRGVIDGRALVNGTTTLYDSGRPPPTTRAGWPFSVVGALLAVFGLVVARRSSRADRRLSALADGTMLFLCGLSGLVLTVLWFGTLHHVTANNGNLLWAAPSHVLVAFLLGRCEGAAWLRVYTGAAGALMLVAWLGGLASWLQPMPAMLQLVLPWLGCRLLWRGSVTTKVSPVRVS